MKIKQISDPLIVCTRGGATVSLQTQLDHGSITQAKSKGPQNQECAIFPVFVINRASVSSRPVLAQEVYPGFRQIDRSSLEIVRGCFTFVIPDQDPATVKQIQESPDDPMIYITLLRNLDGQAEFAQNFALFSYQIHLASNCQFCSKRPSNPLYPGDSLPVKRPRLDFLEVRDVVVHPPQPSGLHRKIVLGQLIKLEAHPFVYFIGTPSVSPNVIAGQLETSENTAESSSEVTVNDLDLKDLVPDIDGLVMTTSVGHLDIDRLCDMLQDEDNGDADVEMLEDDLSMLSLAADPKEPNPGNDVLAESRKKFAAQLGCCYGGLAKMSLLSPLRNCNK